MTGYIKKRPIIAAVLVAIFALAHANVLAQTEETTTAPTLDAAVEVEMERRFNEFRSQYLDDRADAVTRWLTVIAIVLAFFGVVVAIAIVFGFKRFRDIETEARKHVDEARKHVDEIKAHKARAEKDVLAIRREMTGGDAADPAKAKQVKRAVEAARQTPKASPIDKAIAMAYSLQKAGKTETDEAIKKWRAIAHLMEGIDNEFASLAMASVGYLLENPKDQISAYSEAIRLDSGNVIAYNNRGFAKNNLKQHKEAIKDCDGAIQLDPKHVAAYNNRGNAKAALKQHKEAIEDYDEAIRLDPKYAVAYFNRGNTKATLKQHKEAIEDYDEAIRLQIDLADAYNNRGVRKLELNCIDEARSDLQIALRLAKERGDEKFITSVTNTLRKMDNS